MHIALGGHDELNPDDPFWLLPPVADVQQFPQTTQQGLEDLQIFAFLTAISVGSGIHPLAVSLPPSDPPDRLLHAGDSTFGVELTQLTLEDLRTDLGPIRSFGRRLQSALEAAPDYEHLRGRLVNLAPLGPTHPRDPDASMSALLAGLKEDKGCLAEAPVDVSQGLPEQLPDLGFYGDLGDFNVHVNGGPGIVGRIIVSASLQSEVRRSQAVEVLEARVAAKDKPQNDIVLITCGLPDKLGYVCGVDQWIFHVLRELARAGELTVTPPRHVGIVVLHNLATAEWVELHRAAVGSAPWSG